MNKEYLIKLSERNAPSPDNDRWWVFKKMEERALGGYRSIELRHCYDEMPGGGTKERFDALMKALEKEGLTVEESRDFSGPYRKISW